MSEFQLTCIQCTKIFISATPNAKLFCSRRCAGIHTAVKNGKTPRVFVSATCEHCKNEFTCMLRANGQQRKKFCNRFCAQQHISQYARSYEYRYQKWVERYGEEKADLLLEDTKRRRSEATTKLNTGTHHSEETKQRLSDSVKQAYVDGKLKSFGGNRRNVVYKGTKLRSKLERAAIQFLEQRDGLELGKTLLYEDASTRVQWRDTAGMSHTYCPDLHDTVNGVIYEVKPMSLVKKDANCDLKLRALSRSGFKAAYLTDMDIGHDWSAA